MLWCARPRAVAGAVFFLLFEFVLNPHISFSASGESSVPQPEQIRDCPPYAGWLVAVMVALMIMGLIGLFVRHRRAKRVRFSALASEHAVSADVDRIGSD